MRNLLSHFSSSHLLFHKKSDMIKNSNENTDAYLKIWNSDEISWM